MCRPPTLSVVLCLLLFAACGQAMASPECDTLGRSGPSATTLRDRGRLHDAIAAYRREIHCARVRDSQQLIGLLHEFAEVLAEEGRIEEAIETYSRSRSLPAIDSARRARADARIDVLTRRLPGDLFVACSELDMRIKVVDHPTDQMSRPCPTRWQRLAPGAVVLRISGPNGPPFEHTVDVRPADTLQAHIPERATLSLIGLPPDSEAWFGRLPVPVDGRAVRLPARADTLRVSAPGYADSHEPLRLKPAQRLDMRPTLVPDGGMDLPLPAYVRWSTLGTGVAALMGGTAAMVLSDLRFEASAEMNGRVAGSPDRASGREVFDGALALRDEGRTARAWGTGLLITGAVLVAGSGVLFNLAPEDGAAAPAAFTTSRTEMP